MSIRTPYPYQTIVAETLLRGRSVVLQAPTGAGKTHAALLPFLHAWREETHTAFPSKCVYVVPMRVLANQFVLEYKKVSKSIKRRYRKDLKVHIQTGDQQEDKRFEGDLIFCTVDQFLSSYLTMPFSLPASMANLNAGAMVGSYLVLDEFHLLDPGSTLPSVLYAIKQLREIAPVLLMTATFSATMLDNLAKEIEADVILVSPEEAHRIENRSGLAVQRGRKWYCVESPLAAQSVLDSHNTRSLALCNTVRGAQALYRDLRSSIREKGLDVDVILLHSRFLDEDRKKKEEILRERFGKDAKPDGSVIAVATQTIEVGVDITCENLHTELAPASALIQRAGRCARYPGEQGQVFVYAVDSFSPYGRAKVDRAKEGPWVKEMRSALEWLHGHSGELFDFCAEQNFVNSVATPRDEKVLFELSAGSTLRADRIQRVLTGERSPDDRRLLVRETDSRTVLIHSCPDELLSNPYNATGFNIQTGTLYGMLKDWMERDIDLDWRVMRLVEDKNNEGERWQTEYDWKALNDRSLLASTQLIVVNPQLAGYSKDEGFIADSGASDFESSLPPHDPDQLAWEGFSYKLESYEDHVARVLRAFQEIVLPELRFPARAMERLGGWPEGSLMEAAWLACLFHDVGKLSVGWQAWARAYQQKIGSPIASGFAAAHTDFSRENRLHREAQKAVAGKFPKPPHSGEGALAVSGVVVKALGRNELAKACLTAIARHHAPYATECSTYKLELSAKEHIVTTSKLIPKEVLKKIDISFLRSDTSTPPISFSSVFVQPANLLDWLAYALLARAVRRADQEGSARGSREPI